MRAREFVPYEASTKGIKGLEGSERKISLPRSRGMLNQSMEKALKCEKPALGCFAAEWDG